MSCIRIEVAENGYTLSYDDPEVIEQNRSDKGWSDPTRTRVYNTPDALTADLAKLLPLMQDEATKDPDDSAEFSRAIAEAFSKQE